jgi:hypothetical protein
MKAWGAALLAIPLLGASSQLAHALAYRVVIPDPLARTRYYEETGHAYLGYAPLLIGIGAALVVLGLVAHAARGPSPRRGRLAAWPFAALPFLVFAVQEHSERALQSGDFALDVALGPTFVVGFLLQLPCGLLAYAVARYLLRLADGLVQLLGETSPRLAFPPIALLPPSPAGTSRPRLQALALCAAGRAPPLSRS